MAVTYIPTKNGSGYVVVCLSSDTQPPSTAPGSLLETDTGVLYFPDGGGSWTPVSSGSGDVVGPASAVDGHLAVFDGTSGKLIKDGGAPSGGGGVVVQVVNTQTGTQATGSTVIPLDDTIPQNTEGDEYMTLAVTPTDAANTLRIDVVFFGSTSAAAELSVALFQDSTANALACNSMTIFTSTARGVVVISHYMTAGTTSATTFKVRAGSNAGATITFNGAGGNRLYGGVAASSITITEIVP